MPHGVQGLHAWAQSVLQHAPLAGACQASLQVSTCSCSRHGLQTTDSDGWPAQARAALLKALRPDSKHDGPDVMLKGLPLLEGLLPSASLPAVDALRQQISRCTTPDQVHEQPCLLSCLHQAQQGSQASA